VLRREGRNIRAKGLARAAGGVASLRIGLALAVAALLVGAGPAHARRYPVLRVSFGYSRKAKADCWVPSRVTVTNNENRPQSYTVVAYDNSTLPRTLAQRRFTVPARSMKTLRLYVRPPTCERVTFELRQGERVIATANVTPWFLSPRDGFVLAFGAGEGALSVPADRERESQGKRLVFLNVGDPQMLPERWMGYDTLDAVALNPVGAEELPPAQRRALVAWVRRGGLLILTATERSEWLANGFLTDLSPVEVLGRRWLHDFSSLTRAFGPWQNPPVRIPLTEARPLDGEVLLRAGQLPLVVARDEGAGRVVFVGFDLSNDFVRRWEHLEGFYWWLLRQRDATGALGQTRLRQEAPTLLMAMMGARVVSRGTIAVWLGVYLLLFVAGYIFARHRGRPELAWPLGLGVAPLFAVAVYLAGGALSGVMGASAASLSLVRTGPGDRTATVQSLVGLLSPEGASCEIGLPHDASAFFWPVPPAPADREQVGATAGGMDLMLRDVLRLRGVRLAQRFMLPIEVVRCVPDFGRIEGRATPGPDGIEVRVTNASPHTLRDPFVVFNRNVAALEDLSPGESATVRLTRATALATPKAFSHALVKGEKELRRDRVVKALFSRRYEALADTAVRFFGWVEPAAVNGDLEVDGLARPLDRREEALWSVRLPWTAPPAGAGVLVPKGAALALPTAPQMPYYRRGQWEPIVGTLHLTLDFQVPWLVRDLHPRRITLFLGVGGAAARTELAVWNRRTGTWDEVERAGREVALERPRDYYAPGSGTVRVRVLAAPVVTLAETTVRERLPWIEDLDVEMAGVLPVDGPSAEPGGTGSTRSGSGARKGTR